MARFDAAMGRYIYLPIDGIASRVSFEETGTGIPRGASSGFYADFRTGRWTMALR